MQSPERRQPEHAGPITAPRLRETDEIEAAWRRTLVITTRLQLLLTAVLTLSALVIGYFILPNVPLAGFLAVIAWVAFSTLVTGWLSVISSRRGLEEHWALRLSLFSSILTVTSVTYLVGEAQGDFYLIYFLPILTAGIYFGLRGAVLTAVVGGGSYLLLAKLAVGLPASLLPTLTLRVSFFFLIAAAVGLLAEGQRYLIEGLRLALDRATQLAMIDALTGIFNRRFVTSFLQEELSRLTRHRTSMALMAIDVDYFKRYNDVHGHLAGDEALRRIAGLLRDACRASDVVGRFGGDEFAIVLPRTTAEQALSVAQRIGQLTAKAFDDVIADARPTLTIGIAACPEDAETIEELFARADEALYRAKDRGRNQVLCWSDLAHAGREESSPT